MLQWEGDISTVSTIACSAVSAGTIFMAFRSDFEMNKTRIFIIDGTQLLFLFGDFFVVAE